MQLFRAFLLIVIFVGLVISAMGWKIEPAPPKVDMSQCVMTYSRSIP